MKFLKNILLFAIITLFLLGCNVKDDFMDNCYRPYLLKVVKSPDADDDFHPGIFAPDDISLMMEPVEVQVYVFSKEMIFLGKHRAKVNDIIELPYRDYEQIYTVAVSTGKGEPIESLFSQLEIGKQYDKIDLLFSLTPIFSNQDIAQSPTDFMYASNNFKINPYNDKNVIYYLYLDPRIGALKIIAHNLAEWANKEYGESGLPEDKFTYIVGTTYDKYNIEGNLYGEQKSYQPETLYDENKAEIGTPMFNMMPTSIDNSLLISIYRNDIAIFKKTISPKKGKQVVWPRAPYIINLYFDSSNDDAGLSVTPALFEEVLIHVSF